MAYAAPTPNEFMKKAGVENMTGLADFYRTVDDTLILELIIGFWRSSRS